MEARRSDQRPVDLRWMLKGSKSHAFLSRTSSLERKMVKTARKTRRRTVAGSQARQDKRLEAALGQVVREFRKRAELGIAELRKRAQLAAGMLSKIEKGAI